MGRKAIPKSEKKCPISSRVSPAVKEALDVIAKRDRRNVSQVVEILLEGCREVKTVVKGNSRAK